MMRDLGGLDHWPDCGKMRAEGYKVNMHLTNLMRAATSTSAYGMTIFGMIKPLPYSERLDALMVVCRFQTLNTGGIMTYTNTWQAVPLTVRVNKNERRNKTHLDRYRAALEEAKVWDAFEGVV